MSPCALGEGGVAARDGPRGGSDDSGVPMLGAAVQPAGGAAESHQPLAARCPQAAAEITEVPESSWRAR